MHTTPTEALAGTPRGQEAQQLISRCVHCGFCLPACPTYRLLGNELDSPRGRIYLIKQLVEGAEPGTARRHLDRCLTCRSCESACPSGVEYGRLVDLGRELLEESGVRSSRERGLRWLLTETLSRRRLFRTGLRLAQLASPLLPRALRDRVPAAGATVPARPPDTGLARRVVLLEGCVQPALRPSINAATARVLERIGIGVLHVDGETCCGALAHHLGRTERALEQARRNADVLSAALDAGAEAIVSTTTACGLMTKDYARLLAQEPAARQRAARVTAATRDLSEIISPEDLARAGLPNRPRGPVAWQSPCTLQHGQGIAGKVEKLLESAGFTLTAVEQATACCGSAGTYSLLQPDISQALRERKLATLVAGQPLVIASANIGCIEHLGAVAPVPVRHWIELIDEALSEGDAAVTRGN